MIYTKCSLFDTHKMIKSSCIYVLYKRVIKKNHLHCVLYEEQVSVSLVLNQDLVFKKCGRTPPGANLQRTFQQLSAPASCKPFDK